MPKNSFFEDRQNYIIAVAVRSKITPEKNCFATMVINRLKEKFSCSTETAKIDITILNGKWRKDRWLKIVEVNPYLGTCEKQAWKTKIKNI